MTKKYELHRVERDDAGIVETWVADFADRGEAFAFAQQRAGSRCSVTSGSSGDRVFRGARGAFVLRVGRH